MSKTRWLVLSLALSALACGKSAVLGVIPGSACTDSDDCTPGNVCIDGICSSPTPEDPLQTSTGCVLNGASYPEGAAHPGLQCKVCLASNWASRENGLSCGTGLVCGDGSCVAGCFVDGGIRAPGEVNASNSCQVCEPTSSSSQWTTTCFDYYLPYVPKDAPGNGTNASIVIQDTRDPMLVPANSGNMVQVTFYRTDGTPMGTGEQYLLSPGSQLTLTVDPAVLVTGPQMARSTTHTQAAHAAAHLNARAPVQVLTYLTPPRDSTVTANDASAYSAPASHAQSPTLFATGLSNGTSRWTSLAVMNTSATPTRLSLRFFDRAGAQVLDTAVPQLAGGDLPGHGSVVVDLRDLELGLPADFEGTAVISAAPAAALAAVVNEWGPEVALTPAVGRSTWLATAVPGARIALPFVESTVDGALTDLLLFNPGMIAANGTMLLKDRDQTAFGPLAPRATLPLLGAELPPPYQGMGWMNVTQPVVGVLREETQVQGPPAGRFTTAWNLPTDVGAARSVFLPVYFNGALNGLSNRTGRTRLQIANFGPRDDLVQVTYRDAFGKTIASGAEVPVPRAGVVEMDPPTSPLVGTLVLSGSAPDSKLRAIVRFEEGSGESTSLWGVSVP